MPLNYVPWKYANMRRATRASNNYDYLWSCLIQFTLLFVVAVILVSVLAALLYFLAIAVIVGIGVGILALSVRKFGWLNTLMVVCGLAGIVLLVIGLTNMFGSATVDKAGAVLPTLAPTAASVRLP